MRGKKIRSSPVNSRVPQSLVLFLFFETSTPAEKMPHIPDEVVKLTRNIQKWIATKNARTPINKSFATLRTKSPQKLTSIITWLEQPDVCHLFSSGGAFGAREEILAALKSILAGKTAHAAFGMSENNGRPPNLGFSRALDAAFYAEYKIRFSGSSVTDALSLAAEIFDARKELVEIERQKISTVQDAEVKEMAKISCLKYGLIL